MEAEKAGKKGGGTLIRGEDGSLYFIRDEALAAFKVEGEGLKKIQSVAKDKDRLSYVSGDLLKDQPAGRAVPDLLVKPGAVKSTVMCPWFC